MKDMIDNTPKALLVTTVGTLATLAGITGMTQADISGFVNVCGVLISLFGIIWAHVSHKSAIANVPQSQVV